MIFANKLTIKLANRKNQNYVNPVNPYPKRVGHFFISYLIPHPPSKDRSFLINGVNELNGCGLFNFNFILLF